MSNTEQERRSLSRSPFSFSIVVKGRESSNEFWKETADVVNVSKLGASFNLRRECPAGRVVSLIMNMPARHRCYDLDKKLYRIWGLVQYCSPVQHDDEIEYQIGVAFVGKHAPQSYLEDPLKSYRVSGMDEEGFWHIGEAKAPFVARSFHRYGRAFEARVSIVGIDGEEGESDENAITENVSEGGTAVFSNLEAFAGDRVRFTCDEHNFSAICVVRNQQKREGDRSVLHLEFTDSSFPIKEMDLTPEDRVYEDEDSENSGYEIKEAALVIEDELPKPVLDEHVDEELVDSDNEESDSIEDTEDATFDEGEFEDDAANENDEGFERSVNIEESEAVTFEAGGNDETSDTEDRIDESENVDDNESVDSDYKT